MTSASTHAHPTVSAAFDRATAGVRRLRHALPVAFAVAGATCMAATVACDVGGNAIAVAATSRWAVPMVQIGSLITGIIGSIRMTRPRTVAKA